jgi:hypothetical protein
MEMNKGIQHTAFSPDMINNILKNEDRLKIPNVFIEAVNELLIKKTREESFQ